MGNLHWPDIIAIPDSFKKLDILNERCSNVDTCPTALSGASSLLFMAMTNSLFGKKCSFLKESHFPRRLKPWELNLETFDFIVVGGGSAGSTVASRLRENPDWTVLLLEAGGYPPVDAQIPGLFINLQGTEHDWRYLTERSNTSCLGMRDGRCICNRGKMLGGSSSMNAMMHVRGNPADYNEWAEINGDPAWRWDNVLRYFKKQENCRIESLRDSPVRGHSGPIHTTKYEDGSPMRQRIITAYEELGYRMEDEEQAVGAFDCIMSIDERGRRESAAKAFLTNGQHGTQEEDDAPSKISNLFIATYVHVTKVIIDNGRASGIVANVNGRTIKVYSRNEVILSAGAINTPQLLQISGIGPREDLEKLNIPLVKDLPVGRNLRDHFATWGVLVSLDPNASLSTVQEDDAKNTFDYFHSGSGPLATIRNFNIQLFNDPLAGSSEIATIQWIMRDFSPGTTSIGTFFTNDGFRDESVKSILALNANQTTLVVNPILLRPHSSGYLQLQSANALDKVKIYPGYLTDDRDMETMLAAIRYLKKIIGTRSFREVNATLQRYDLPGCDHLEYDTREYWVCLFRHVGSTMYHVVGTCKMAKEEDGGVVDNHLKVYGIKHFRVIDASVMPMVPRGNTNAPTIMVAERGADLIKRDWGFATDTPE